MLRFGIMLLCLMADVCSLYKVCVLRGDLRSTVMGNCGVLYSSGAQVQCEFGADKMDCLRQVSDGSADFGLFDAEELVVASENDNLQEILITHKFHHYNEKDWEFGVVALTTNLAEVTDLNKLQGKRLCHPGFDPFSSRYDWNEIFSLYFEDRVVPQKCQANLSVEENRIKSMAEFFGDSCIPGLWSSVPQTDASLKATYRNLCALCDIPGDCSTSDKYWGRQGALSCLSDCLGEVAWARLDDVRIHKFSSFDCGEVRFLCPDGSTMPLSTKDPCIWIGRPNSVFAANRQKAEAVQHILFNIFNTSDWNSQEDRILNSLLMRTNSRPLMSPITTPRDYLEKIPGYLSANTMARCGQNSRSIKICTDSTRKQAKCEWLAVAARGAGIEPLISCTLSSNCFESVAQNESDVFISDADNLYTAIRDFSLKPLLVRSPIRAEQVKTVSAIVKTNSGINSLSDLRGKNACFTSYDGHGWNSLILALQDAELLDPVCPYSAGISKLFSQICFTDPKTKNLPYKNMRFCSIEGVYYLLNQTSDPIIESKEQEKNAMAFNCLAIGGGDVAFISIDTVKQYTDKILSEEPWSIGLWSKDYRQLCHGNSSCFLSWSSMGQVLVHKNVPKVKKEDIISVFSSLDNVFGSLNSPSHYTFDLFSKYEELFSHQDGVEDIESRLEVFDAFEKKASVRSNNYDLKIRTMKTCQITSSSSTAYVSLYLIIAGLIL